MGVAALALMLGLGPRLGQDEATNVWRVGGMPAEHHPCLLFAADELPRMRARIEQRPFSAWWSSVAGSDDMVSQALTWRLTGEEAKGEAVRERLLRCNPTGYHCSCGVADALQGVAEAYDLVYDYPGLSEIDHRVIRAKIATACERLYLSALETGNGQHPGNQRTRGICALGTAAMVLAGYEEAAHTPQEWLQRALDGIHEDRNLEFWRDDGLFIEGPTYSAFTLSVMLPFARYYHNVTGQWLFDDPRLRNALQHLVYVTQPDGDCNAMGTTNMMNVVNSLRLAIGAGDLGDQAAYRWALEEWGAISGGVREFCLFDETIRPSISGLPTTRVLPVSQEISWRSEWSRNALAVWLKGKDPWIAGNYPVYSHADAGSFVIHAYGELLAVDAGYDHWVSYGLYPANLHNTLLVDGEGPGQDTPALLENVIDAEFVRSADVVTEYAGVKLRRTFLLVEDQFVVVIDDVEAEAEHEYTWQIHTPVSRATGEVTVDGKHASWTGFDPRTDNPGRVEMHAYWAGNVDVEAVGGSRWQPYSADPKAGSYDNWTVVARQRGRDVRFLTVLCPHPTAGEGFVVEEAPEAGPVAVTISRGEDRLGVAIQDRSTAPRPDTGRLIVTRAGEVVPIEAASRAIAALGTRRGPKVASVQVDGKRFEGRELIDLGRVAAPPHQVWAEFTREGTGLNLRRGRVTLNGVRDESGSTVDMDQQAPTGALRYEWRGQPKPIDYEMVFRVSDSALPPNYGQLNLRFSLRPLLANGGFEEAGGWSFGTWSSDDQTEYETKTVTDQPHSGTRCLMMRGIAGSLNMVASQSLPLKTGATYVLSGYYRGEAPAKASLCNTPGTGQYIWSPAIGPSAEWTPFEWEFTVENPANPLIIALRLGSVGAAYFDDLELQEKAPAP